MYTLLLRLAGPMQSWGAESKFEVRRTEAYPTKSGVIGMLASALGRSRQDSMEDLAGLRFGVRADQRGRLIQDFHTAKSAKHPYMTMRYYLSDAVFLAGLESEDRLKLEELEKALCAPKYPLFLGRRSCPVTLPLVLGIQEGNLEQIFDTYPLISTSPQSTGYVETVIERDFGTHGSFDKLIKDQPVSFSPIHRVFDYRKTAAKFIETDHLQPGLKSNKLKTLNENVSASQEKLGLAEHDAFGSLLSGGAA